MLHDFSEKYKELLGKDPSPEAEQRVLQLIKTFGMEDVSEFLYLVMTHEVYKETTTGEIRALIEGFNTSVGDVTQSFESEFARQGSKAVETLAAGVVDTSKRLAREQTDIEWFRWIVKVGGVLLLFGSICFICGMAIMGQVPPWVNFYNPSGKGLLGLVVSAILGAPAGWILLLGMSFLPFQWLFGNWASIREKPKKHLKGIIASVGWLLGAFFVLVRMLG